MSSPYRQPKPTAGVQVRGRPVGARTGEIKSDSFRLNTILPRSVLDELLREEQQSEVYRTRVAANVLCNWARDRAISRSKQH